MRPPKYPLDPLARLRAKQVDDATKELAGSVRARAKAADEVDAAEQRRSQHQARAAGERVASGEALARGELRAADLMRQGAWESRVHAEGEDLARRVEGARDRETATAEDEARARAAAATRKAEAEAVAKDEARWQKRRADRAEAREDEATADAWAGKAKR